MNKFDKKIREMSKNIQTPASYDQKVDDLLKTLTEQPEELPRKNTQTELSPGRARYLRYPD